MNLKLSGKARERLLYLISPIGLIIVWQLLLMVGIGDRRFVPAPSDIAERFVKPTSFSAAATRVARSAAGTPRVKRPKPTLVSTLIQGNRPLS